MKFLCTFCSTIINYQGNEVNVVCNNCKKHVAVPKTKFDMGCIIDDFILNGVIGTGGMATVYLAKQMSMDRNVALKVLAPKYAKQKEFVQSFLKEARSAARINHPNLVQAVNVGKDGDILYYAMEYVNGVTLAERLRKEQTLDYDLCLNIIQQSAEALHEAWTQENIIHRDIKPDNIMLAEDGYAKIMDLGIAIKQEEAETAEISGTPAYMAPEQFRQEALDCRTDIYALGVTLYQSLAGFPPFEGDNVEDLAQKHVFSEVHFPDKSLIHIPQRIKHLIEKMMAKKPEERYQDYDELLNEIVIIRRRLTPNEDQIPSVHTISFSKYRLFDKMTESPSEVYRKRSSKRKKVAIAKEQTATMEDDERRKKNWVYISSLTGIILVLAIILIIIVRSNRDTAFIKEAHAYIQSESYKKLLYPDLTDPDKIVEEVKALNTLIAAHQIKTHREQAYQIELQKIKIELENTRIEILHKRIIRQNNDFRKRFQKYIDEKDGMETQNRRLKHQLERIDDLKSKLEKKDTELKDKEDKLEEQEAKNSKDKAALSSLSKLINDEQISNLKWSLNWKILTLCRMNRYKEAVNITRNPLISDNSKMKTWAENKLIEIRSAARFYQSVYDSGLRLKGMRLKDGRVLSIDGSVLRLSVAAEEGGLTTKKMSLSKLGLFEFLQLAEKSIDDKGKFNKQKYYFCKSGGHFIQLVKVALKLNKKKDADDFISGIFNHQVNDMRMFIEANNKKYVTNRAKFLRSNYSRLSSHYPILETIIAEIIPQKKEFSPSPEK
ncbi:MAG: protein kinase [Lentisphaeria bacterium]|nr:protein kinase [Lentisphaeria bacterium]